MMWLLLIILIPYLIPGLFLARGVYSEQVREIRNSPAPNVVSSIPVKPTRPRIKMSEMLHNTSPVKCGLLREKPTLACSCRYRKQWEDLKNEWLDYNEWNDKYGKMDLNKFVAKAPTPNMKAVYASVPFWPVMMGIIFIKGGAKSIPDYREIERLEDAAGITKELQ